MSEQRTLPTLDGGVELDSSQWRAEQMQLVNWGGFHGSETLEFSPGATLVAGATGSGKSTILDAYLALMMDSNTAFNGASNDATVGRARSKEQRSLLTYLRGKLDDLTADGEDTARVLRGAHKATWGAIAVTFVDGAGERFSVVRLYHVPRAAASDTDITKKLCTIDGGVDVRDFAELAADRFDKKALERRYSTIKMYPSYTQFAAAFQTRLGIGEHGDGNNALRLLARIQAGKAMPSVDALFKTMVLDTPPTYAAAENAAAHFADLETSYDLMVTAQRKQRVLDGIVDAWEQRRTHMATLDAIADLRLDRNQSSPFAHWAASTERGLLDGAVALNDDALRTARRTHLRLVGLRDRLRREHRDAERAYEAAGGGTIAKIDDRLDELGRAVAAAELARTTFDEGTAVLGVDTDSSDALLAAQGAAVAYLEGGHDDATKELTARRDAFIRDQLWPHQQHQRELTRERESLAGRAGRVPQSWHEARVEAAHALGVDPTELPFVAELLDIATDHDDWRNAAEVMLAPLARVLIVDDRLLDRFTTAIDQLRWGVRLPYEGVEQRDTTLRERDPAMLSGRLTFKDDSPYTWWIHKRVTSAKFDALCVETPRDLVGSERRVTRSGQTRKGRSGAHGRSHNRAIIGFDNTSRIAEIAAQLDELDGVVKAAEAELAAFDTEGRHLEAIRDAHRRVAEADWASIDPESLRTELGELETRRARLLESDDHLAELEKALNTAYDHYDKAYGDAVLAGQHVERLETTETMLDERAAALDVELGSLNAHGADHVELLEPIFAATADDADYDPASYALRIASVLEALHARHSTASAAIGTAEAQLTKAFRSYQDQWPDPNLGVGVDSYPNYLEIFDSITASGLHEKREEWAHRVTSWTGEDLVPLHLAFDEAVEEIKSRLAPINAILDTLAFGAHRDRLRIDLRQKHHDDHARFRKQLKELSSGVLGAVSFEAVEARFHQLRTFIDLIRPGATGADHSRNYYLDVHDHLELSAVAVKADGEPRATYTSLGGKSGGETQELAAFIVGSALRYQLGDETRSVPRFAPVFLDEGFVKADSEFAGRSVAAWRGLGFQLVVATAFGTVTALERHMDLILQVTKNPSSGRARVSVLTAVSP